MIKKLLTIAALAMLLGSPTSYAVVVFQTGNSLAEYCEQDDSRFQAGFCYGYVTGLFDKMQGEEICMPDGVTIKQLGSIVKKFLREHPEDLHLSARSLVSAALVEAFPCN
jgi:hypothetical protein